MDRYIEMLNEYANKAYQGLKNRKLDNPSMGIDHAENQRIRRLKEFKEFDGSVGLFICNECAEAVGGISNTITFHRQYANMSEKGISIIDREIAERKLKEAEELLSLISTEAILCAIVGMVVKLAEKENSETITRDDATLLQIVHQYHKRVDPKQNILTSKGS